MNTLIQLLINTLKNIEPAAGADAESLRGLLRNLAALNIQLDPSQAVIPPGDFDPRIVEAIHDAVELVADLGKTSTRLRLFEEELPRGTPAIGDQPEQTGEQASEIFGPFVGRQGVLERLKAFRSGAFLRVMSHIALVGPNELQILIPAASTPDAPDLRNWTLAPGTVWIASRFLVQGTTGFTGLRIKGGTMKVDAAARTDAVTIQLPSGLPAWSLSLEPEATPPSGAGSDGDALALTLPTRLDVHFHAPPVVSGAPVLSGFGSDIHFAMSGAPHTAGSQILFPMQAAEPTWSISGNASGLATFSGESAVASADYALTISSTDPDFLAEAAHGGSLVVRLGTPFSSSFAAQQGGVSNWLRTVLTANALQIELDCREANSAAAYDLDLWTTTNSAVRFAGQSLSGLFFRSERGAGDTVVMQGGAIRNQWDLPCSADGQPFAFAGRTDTFGLFSNSAGTWITVSATASVSDLLQGLTLENLHLVVKAPRKLFALAPFDKAPQLSSGIAIFQFDVGVAVPILPDPYAVNLAPPDSAGTVESALGVILAWTDGQTPALSVELFQPVPFPEQGAVADPDLANPDEAAVYQVFENHLQCQKTESLFMLDLSSKEHLFGVALESAASIRPEIIDNRLSVPLNRIRLLLQPQVQWEPVLDDPNPDAGPSAGVVHSFLEGGPSLVGANSVKLVPVLAANLSGEILEAIGEGLPAAALFSLPFGLRATATLDFRPQIVVEGFLPATFSVLIEPALGGLKAARQLRLIATGFGRPILPSFAMPGIMRQLENLDANSSLRSVLPSELRIAITTLFGDTIPLTHADLSGYGMSTFSEWHENDFLGGGPQFTKAEFRVLNGRTAYEVIQFRSILYECGARVVRTVVLERHNSGRVIRKDSGWVAVDDGLFAVPILFQKGAVNSFRNIRRIRVTSAAPIDLGDGGEVEPVIFDADVDVEGAAGPVPIYDRPGYIQTFPRFRLTPNRCHCRDWI